MIDITEYKLEDRLSNYNPNGYTISPENYTSEIAEITFPEMERTMINGKNFRTLKFKFNNPELADSFLKRFEAKEDLLMKLEGVYILLYGITDKVQNMICGKYVYVNEEVPKMYDHLLCELTVRYDNIVSIDSKVAIRNLKLNSLEL